jgi:hypothetical protein
MAGKPNSSPYTPEQHRIYFSHRLPDARFNGHRETSVRCPFHDDGDPSMSVNADQGVWHCFTESIGGGILQFEERYSDCDHDTARRNVAELLGLPIPQPLSGGSTLDFAPSKRIIATYEYWDEHHRELKFRKLRLEGKHFILQRPMRSGWVNNLDGMEEKPPYGLPELITADTVLVAEGEKDCDLLRSLHLEERYPHLRFAYVTNFDGAGKWRETYSRYFAGKDAVIFADNDEPGKQHAREVARSLDGLASGIRLIEFPELPEKGDVSDWLDSQGDNECDLRQALFERIEKTLPWRDEPTEQWKSLFHSPEEIVNARPASFAIEGFLPEDGTTLIGAPPGNSKTFLMLAVTRALLEGGKFLHHFAVNRVAERVLYLIPQSGLSPLAGGLAEERHRDSLNLPADSTGIISPSMRHNEQHGYNPGF